MELIPKDSKYKPQLNKTDLPTTHNKNKGVVTVPETWQQNKHNAITKK